MSLLSKFFRSYLDQILTVTAQIRCDDFKSLLLIFTHGVIKATLDFKPRSVSQGVILQSVIYFGGFQVCFIFILILFTNKVQLIITLMWLGSNNRLS